MRGPAFFLSGDSYPHNAHVEDAMRARFATAFPEWISQVDLPGKPGDAVDPRDIAWRLAQLDDFLAAWQDARTAVLMGRSSGARVITQLAARRDVSAVICFGYPFRRPNHVLEPDRFGHLATIRVPVLIVQGTDDPYGGIDLTEHYAVSPAVHFLFVPGTHELALSSGAWDRVSQAVIRFCDAAALGAPMVQDRFDEAFYLRANPDVAAAVAAGVLASGEQHYHHHGRSEGRNFRLLPPGSEDV